MIIPPLPLLVPSPTAAATRSSGSPGSESPVEPAHDERDAALFASLLGALLAPARPPAEGAVVAQPGPDTATATAESSTDAAAPGSRAVTVTVRLDAEGRPEVIGAPSPAPDAPLSGTVAQGVPAPTAPGPSLTPVMRAEAAVAMPDAAVPETEGAAPIAGLHRSANAVEVSPPVAAERVQAQVSTMVDDPAVGAAGPPVAGASAPLAGGTSAPPMESVPLPTPVAAEIIASTRSVATVVSGEEAGVAVVPEDQPIAFTAESFGDTGDEPTLSEGDPAPEVTAQVEALDAQAAQPLVDRVADDLVAALGDEVAQGVARPAVALPREAVGRSEVMAGDAPSRPTAARAPEPPPRFHHATVILDRGDGSDRVRVMVRGDTVHATILTTPTEHPILASRADLLRQALIDRGFGEAQVLVRTVPGAEQAAPLAPSMAADGVADRAIGHAGRPGDSDDAATGSRGRPQEEAPSRQRGRREHPAEEERR